MPYRSKGRHYTYGVKTLAQIDAIVSPQEGQTVFCSDNNRVMTYDDDGIWMCCDFIKLINITGATRSRGDLVAFSNTSNTGLSCTVAATADPRVAGPVVFGNINGQYMAIAYKGIYRINMTDNPTNEGNLWNAAATDYEANDAGTVMGVGFKGLIMSTTKVSNQALCLIKPHTVQF